MMRLLLLVRLEERKVRVRARAGLPRRGDDVHGGTRGLCGVVCGKLRGEVGRERRGLGRRREGVRLYGADVGVLGLADG